MHVARVFVRHPVFRLRGRCVLAAASCGRQRGGRAGRRPPGQSLFDGKSLDGWKKTAFGGEGEVEVEDGQIMMRAGNPMTGITWTGEVPRWTTRSRSRRCGSTAAIFSAG